LIDKTVGVLEGLAYALSLVEHRDKAAAAKLRQCILTALKGAASDLPFRLGVAA